MSPLVIQYAARVQPLENKRLHWSVRARIVARERRAAGLHCLAGGVGSLTRPRPLSGPLVTKRRASSARRRLPVEPIGRVRVLLERIAPRELDDDNLRGALKPTRDGVSDVLGIDDKDPRVTWSYA